jgi:hypothetical protein
MRQYQWAALAIGLVLSLQSQAQNLVKNGGFENVSSKNGSTSSRYDVRNGSNFSLDNWVVPVANSDVIYPVGTADYVKPGQDGAAGYPGQSIWGLQNGANNGFGPSPDGGNFFGSSAYYGGGIYQDVSGFTVGKTYTLSFWYAVATSVQSTATVSGTWNTYIVGVGDGPGGWALNPTQTKSVTLNKEGFSGWMQASYTFVANSTIERLVMGTVTNSPPMMLLDGVTILEGANTLPVPENSSWAMMLVGGGVIARLLQRRRNRQA